MIDQDSFRDAMARLGAAVSIVTTLTPDGPVGMTASAICSVTDEPPTLLLCVNRDSELNDAFKASRLLCVNALSAAQERLSPIFASMTGHTQPARFLEAEWTTMSTGAPVLADALVSFDCRVTEFTEIGTHTVFFCEIEAVQAGSGNEALIYVGRAYHRIAMVPA